MRYSLGALATGEGFRRARRPVLRWRACTHSAHGKICYVQIPATDIERSAAFYEQVFGWSTPPA